MKIVITGSSGFIGSKLLAKIDENKHTIIKVDLDQDFDVTNWNSVKSIKNFDVLVHLAAITYVPSSYEKPRGMYEVNISGTLNMLELCRINNAKMIFASSYVYGKPQYLPIDEIHPTVAFNPYCHSKLIGEDLCESYHKNFGVPIIIFRPFNIYGKGQDENFLIPLIKKQIEQSETVKLNDPRPKRDFLHVDDLVEAYIKAIEFKDPKLEVFNVGSGMSYSVEEIANIMITSSKEKIKLEFSSEARINEVLDTVADTRKIKQMLNWQPKISFIKGIETLMDG